MIGVFWIYENQIYYKAIKKEKITTINGFKDSDFSHYEIWNEILNKHPKFYMFEYENIPRGRIVYDETDNKYIVYTNNEIINSKKSKELILNSFNLESKKVEFKNDEHYKI